MEPEEKQGRKAGQKNGKGKLGVGSRTEGRRDNKGHKEKQGGTREQHRRMKKERDGEWGREIKKKTTVMGSRIEDWKEKNKTRENTEEQRERQK